MKGGITDEIIAHKYDVHRDEYGDFVYIFEQFDVEEQYKLYRSGKLVCLQGKKSKRAKYFTYQPILKASCLTYDIRISYKRYHFNIALVVAHCFLPDPETHEKSYYHLAHRDGNVMNCDASNLEWVRHKYRKMHYQYAIQLRENVLIGYNLIPGDYNERKVVNEIESLFRY